MSAAGAPIHPYPGLQEARQTSGKQEVIDTEWTKDRIEENTWINRVRFEVDRWRIGGRA